MAVAAIRGAEDRCRASRRRDPHRRSDRSARRMGVPAPAATADPGCRARHVAADVRRLVADARHPSLAGNHGASRRSRRPVGYDRRGWRSARSTGATRRSGRSEPAASTGAAIGAGCPAAAVGDRPDRAGSASGDCGNHSGRGAPATGRIRADNRRVTPASGVEPRRARPDRITRNPAAARRNGRAVRLARDFGQTAEQSRRSLRIDGR